MAETGRFRRSDRLLDGRDFERVLRRGRRRSSPELVVVTSGDRPALRATGRAGSQEAVVSRLGITVGRKAGNSVKRNRFKRRVREWFRQHRSELRSPVDIVVIARRPAVDLSSADLACRLARLLDLKQTQPPGNPEDLPAT